MNAGDIIAIAAILIIISCAAAYIIKAKKSGKKCIGCPYASSCSGKCASYSCGCGASGNDKENCNK